MLHEDVHFGLPPAPERELLTFRGGEKCGQVRSPSGVPTSSSGDVDLNHVSGFNWPCRSIDKDTLTSYTTALGLWRRSGAVHILSLPDTKIASFPMSFLLSCGDKKWDYILHIVSLLVEVDSHHPGGLLDDLGRPVDTRRVPASGTFRYVESVCASAPVFTSSLIFGTVSLDKPSDVVLARGPEFFNRDIAPLRRGGEYQVRTITRTSRSSG